MRLRKLLIATSAIAAAGALVLAPTAQANNPTGTNINSLRVNNNPANLDYPMTLTVKSGQLQVAVYGVPTTANCTGGSGTGTVKGGTASLAPLAGELITGLALNCPSIFPGTTLSTTVTCNIEVVFSDPNVHAGLVDVGVPGTPKFSAVDGTLHLTERTNPLSHCLRVNISNGCQFFIGGSTPVLFNETVKSSVYQDLHLVGTGLQVKDPTGCLGAVVTNTPLTLTLIINETVGAGRIDFQ